MVRFLDQGGHVVVTVNRGGQVATHGSRDAGQGQVQAKHPGGA
jgi:hypothetical protein